MKSVAILEITGANVEEPLYVNCVFCAFWLEPQPAEISIAAPTQAARIARLVKPFISKLLNKE